MLIVVDITVHVLQSCPLHKEERKTTWPTESSIGNPPDGTTNITSNAEEEEDTTAISMHLFTVLFSKCNGIYVTGIHCQISYRLFCRELALRKLSSMYL